MRHSFISILAIFTLIFGIQNLAMAADIAINLDNKALSGSLVVEATNPNDTLHNQLQGTVYLDINGTHVAVWHGLEETFNLLPARWQDMSGNPLTEWSQILPASGTATLQIFAELVDTTFAESNIVTLSLQSTLTADFSFTPEPPQTGPDVDVTATSTLSDSAFSYSWKRDNGFEFGTTSVATTTLGVSGLLYGPVAFILRVEDTANNNISYKKKIFTVARPYTAGNPQTEGIPSVNGVALYNGNLYLDLVDMSVQAKGISFLLSRSYNTDTGWRFNYSQKIIKGINGTARITMADGKDLAFFKADDNLWYPYSRTFDILLENGDNTFTLFTKGRIRYHFDTFANGGKLLQVADRNGNTLDLFYDANGYIDYVMAGNSRRFNFNVDSATGHLTSVTDDTGRQIFYTWTAGNLTQVTDLRGETTLLAYDGNGHLTRITDPRGHDIIYTYDTNNRINSFTDRSGNKTSYEYGLQNGTPATTVHAPIDNIKTGYWFDNQGRLKETIDSRNYKSSSLYEKTVTDPKKIADFLLTTQQETPRGSITSYEYSDDGRGNKTKVHQPDQNETALSWIARIRPTDINQTNQNLLSTYIPPGIGAAAYSFQYNPTGQATRLEDPLGRAVVKAYNAAGQMTQKTDARANSTTYNYDANGFLTQVTDADGKTTTYVRDALGRPTAVTDKRGNTTRYTYDAAGNVLTTTDPMGGVTQNTYDANGNRLTTKDPNNNVTSYTYDNNNRLLTTTVTVNGTTYTRSNTYDALGRVISSTNRNSQASHTLYDRAGNVDTRTDPLGNTVHYTYDANNNVKTMTDEEGRTTTYTYDQMDRVIEVRDDQGHTQKTTYNAQGLVASREDAEGRVTRYDYDVAGQRITVTDPDGGITRITYDANGNQQTVTDPKNHVTIYTYDKLNQMTSMTDQTGHVWQYEYDANGNRTREIKPDGSSIETTYDANDRVSTRKEYDTSHALLRSLSYSYDANGNVTSVSNGTSTLHYTYDELNRVKTATDHFGITLSYQYDGVGNLTRLTYPNNKTVQYSYDLADRLQQVTDWLNNTTRYTRNNSGQVTGIALGNGTVVSKSYDSVGRLVLLENKTPTGEIISRHQMTLDKAGNIRQSQAQLPLQPTLPAGSSMSYDAANRILQSNGSTFSHDPNGRIIEQQEGGATITYNFNAQDLITSIEENSTTTAQYIYDVNNNRVSRTIGGVETRFVVDTNTGLPRVLAETDTSGTVQRYYIYGEGLLAQVDGAGNEKFYHFDPTGHTLALTDSSGAITDRYAYTPYGHTIHVGATPNPFQYVGRYGVVDDGNGLHYMRARYYKEGSKRFMSLDALLGDVESPQSLNRYAYVLGNPVMGIDPSGYEPSTNNYAGPDLNALEGLLGLTNLTEKVIVKLISEVSKHTNADPLLVGKITGRSLVIIGTVITLTAGAVEEFTDKGWELDDLVAAYKNIGINASYAWKNDKCILVLSAIDGTASISAIGIESLSFGFIEVNGDDVIMAIENPKKSWERFYNYWYDYGKSIHQSETGIYSVWGYMDWVSRCGFFGSKCK